MRRAKNVTEPVPIPILFNDLPEVQAPEKPRAKQASGGYAPVADMLLGDFGIRFKREDNEKAAAEAEEWSSERYRQSIEEYGLEMSMESAFNLFAASFSRDFKDAIGLDMLMSNLSDDPDFDGETPEEKQLVALRWWRGSPRSIQEKACCAGCAPEFGLLIRDKALGIFLERGLMVHDQKSPYGLRIVKEALGKFTDTPEDQLDKEDSVVAAIKAARSDRAKDASALERAMKGASLAAIPTEEMARC